MSQFGDPEDIGADGGDIHERPVKSIPIVFDHGVGTVLDEVEHDATKVDDNKDNGQIGNE